MRLDRIVCDLCGITLVLNGEASNERGRFLSVLRFYEGPTATDENTHALGVIETPARVEQYETCQGCRKKLLDLLPVRHEDRTR